jgi:hypothetical protein
MRPDATEHQCIGAGLGNLKPASSAGGPMVIDRTLMPDTLVNDVFESSGSPL